MRFNYFTQAAAATAVLASTASAAFNAAANNNLVVYWGQGYAQVPLSDVCEDPTVDIVVIGFINQFPKKVGDYPGSNFGKYLILVWQEYLLTSISKCLRWFLLPEAGRYRRQSAFEQLPIDWSWYQAVSSKWKEGSAVARWRMAY